MRRTIGVCLTALVLVGLLGCGGEPKKDVNRGQDRPVPEDKKAKK